MTVALAGFGVEGKSSYRYYSQLGADITIVDEKANIEDMPEGAKTLLGEGSFEKLHGFDIVVRSPQINPARIMTHGKIWSATNEFFKKCQASIVGVTGTKGKGTTCTLIAEMLQSAGKTVHLVGNIGVPALDVLQDINKEDIVVFELSSFQLWDIERSPQNAVVLMIEPDHMDVHASMDEYVNAKRNITQQQTADDLLVHHPTNVYVKDIVDGSVAQKKAYLTEEGAYLEGDVIKIDDKTICKTSEVGLLGIHNLENICAAITAAWRYTQDISAIKKAIISFKGLPHRIEFVRELNGVKYFDDSYSSAPGASIAAIKSFIEPEIVIIGGFDRDLDFIKLAEAVSKQVNIKHLLLIGDTRSKLANQLRVNGFNEFTEVSSKNLSEIINVAYEQAQPGDVVILSPGCPSFDMFKNFEDRGDTFKKIVRGLA